MSQAGKPSKSRKKDPECKSLVQVPGLGHFLIFDEKKIYDDAKKTCEGHDTILVPAHNQRLINILSTQLSRCVDPVEKNPVYRFDEAFFVGLRLEYGGGIFSDGVPYDPHEHIKLFYSTYRPFSKECEEVLLFPKEGKLEVAEGECGYAKRKFVCYEGPVGENGRDAFYYAIIITMTLVTCLVCWMFIKCLTAKTKSHKNRRSEAAAPLILVGPQFPSASMTSATSGNSRR